MFNNKIRSLTVAAGLVATLAMTSSGAAFAAGTPVSPTNGPTVGSVTIAGTGALTVTAPTAITFTGVTLDGTAHNTPLTGGTPLTIGVSDLTGVGSGWTVSLAPSTFTGTTPTNVLPSSSLSIPAGAGVTLTSSTGTAPVNTAIVTTGGLAIPTSTGSTTATPIFGATTDTGRGASSWNVPLSVNIPLDTRADTYSSNIVVSVATLV